jgi:hypothetical protein
VGRRGGGAEGRRGLRNSLAVGPGEQGRAPAHRAAASREGSA